MHDDQIRLLQTSFAEVLGARDAAAALFYERLFVHDPALKRLFGHADLTAQGEKLFAALSFVMASLKDFGAVVPSLELLGVRHLAYGVSSADYDTVGTAFIETLSLYFGPRFTPELRAAWTGAYGAVASVMKGAAQRASEQERKVRPAAAAPF